MLRVARATISASVLFGACLLPAALAGQKTPILKGTADLRIDADQNDLSRIGWLAMARDGGIAIGQPQDNLVRFFGADGRALGTVGRKGSGPGDFGRVGQAGWLGDTLWVNDDANHRLTLISPAHTFLHTLPLPTGISASARDTVAALQAVSVLGVRSDGTLLLNALLGVSRSTPPPSWAVSKLDTGSPSFFFRATPTGLFRSLTAWLPQDRCGFYLGAQNRYCPRVLADFAPDGSRIAFVTMATAAPDSGTFRVTVIGAAGDTIFSRHYPFTASVIPVAVRDSIAQAFAKERPAPMPLMEWNHAVHTIYPPIGKVTVGRDGTIWLRRWTSGASVAYLVLAPRGDVAGAVEFPAAFTVLAADRSTVWGTARDADDLEHLVRYRIR